MPHLKRQLDVILMMIDGRSHSAEELCKRLGTTRRNLYYFFDNLRSCGFHIIKEGSGFYLDAYSPFFRAVAAGVSFSDDEAAYLFKLVDAVKDRNKYTEAVINKLQRFYDISFITDSKLQNRMMQNVSRIYEAMDRRRVVILQNYSSPHSRTVSNRFVEPFMFMNDHSDIRCYELASHTNKTFKLSRVEVVRLVEDLAWSHDYMHKPVFTDMFLFSGEEHLHITLRLGQLAYNLLCEEYPRAEKYVKKDGERWLFDTEVASYVGIGRFILGLAEDIEVLGDDGLLAYLQEKAAVTQKALAAQAATAAQGSSECAADSTSE